jgi:type IV pilus assembly protein PilB
MIRVNDVTPIRRSVKKPQVAKPVGIDFGDDSIAARELADLLEVAAATHASAIHIEPHGKVVQVRYRVDGLLRPGKALQKTPLNAMAARVKSLANLDTTETRVPQDGRFETTLGGNMYAVRAAVLPVADGEKIVLHLVDQAAAPHDLEQLGYWGNSLHALQDALTHPHGLILVSGPANSGKTATLYGLLHLVTKPTINVATVEDVIEHRVNGINQTPVNLKAGMTFAGALRAVLHQDPNVLMISELREPEATSLALQAALAGRLVVAGIHTRNVAEATAHLVAMHVEPYLLASATRAIANQRLARRLCTDCCQSYQPSSQEITGALQACGLEPASALGHLAELQKQASQELSIPAKAMSGTKIMQLWRANPAGCDTCGHTGYRGRVAINEVLTVSPQIQKLIFANATPTALYDQAIAEGMTPLPMDGLVKAALGVTSLDEVLRVVTE